MTAQPQVKFIALARISDRKILICESKQKASEASFSNEVNSVLGKLEDAYLQPNERQKVKSSNGAWFCISDDKRVHYLLLADSAYPERHAYALVSEIRDELKEFKDYHLDNTLISQNFGKKRLTPLLDKYNDLESMDNLIATKSKVNQIKEVMSDTITKALENRDTLDVLDQKSSDLSHLAAGFYNDSHTLHNRIRARNRRIMIYTGIAVTLAIVIYFITR